MSAPCARVSCVRAIPRPVSFSSTRLIHFAPKGIVLCIFTSLIIVIRINSYSVSSSFCMFRSEYLLYKQLFCFTLSDNQELFFIVVILYFILFDVQERIFIIQLLFYFFSSFCDDQERIFINMYSVCCLMFRSKSLLCPSNYSM